MFQIQPVPQLNTEKVIDLDNAKLMALRKIEKIGYTWEGKDKARLIMCYDVNCPYCASEFVDAIYDIAKERVMTVTMAPHFSTQLGSTILHYLLIDFALNYLPLGNDKDDVLEMFREIFETKISRQTVQLSDLYKIISNHYESHTKKSLDLGEFISYIDGQSKNAIEITPASVLTNIMLQGNPASIPGVNPFFITADTFMQTCNGLVMQLLGKQYSFGVPLNIIYDAEVMKAILIPGRQDKVSLLKKKGELYGTEQKSVIEQSAGGSEKPQ